MDFRNSHNHEGFDRMRHEGQLEEAAAQVGFDMRQAERQRALVARVAMITVIVSVAVAVVGAGAWTLSGRTAAADAATATALEPLPVESADAAVSEAAPAKATAERAVPRQLAQEAAFAPPSSSAVRAAPAKPTASKTTTSSKPPAKPVAAPKPKPVAVQQVSIAIGAAGYEPSAVTVRSGAPIRMTVAKGEGCAAGFLMPQLSISKDNSRGPVSFQIGPLKPGTYTFTCGMGMVTGRLVVN